MTKVTCDLCKTEADYVIRAHIIGGQEAGLSSTIRLDVCKKCYGEIIGFINQKMRLERA